MTWLFPEEGQIYILGFISYTKWLQVMSETDLQF